MPLSPIALATVQAALLTAVSNLIAQILKAHNASQPVEIDWQTLIQIVLFAVVSTPPNFLWQGVLEGWFPSQVPVATTTTNTEGKGDDGGEKKKEEGGREGGGGKEKGRDNGMRLSVSNTVKKFLTDQCVGAPVNTVLYLAAMGWFRGFRGWEGMGGYVREEFWPLTSAGLKVWPLVSLLCFAVIPPEQRIVFGSLVGLGWNVFLGLRN